MAFWAEIEEQLLSDDPGIARRLRWPKASERWPLVGAIALIVLGVLVALVGVVTFDVGLVVIFVATALGGWIWFERTSAGSAGRPRRRWRSAAPSPRDRNRSACTGNGCGYRSRSHGPRLLMLPQMPPPHHPHTRSPTTTAASDAPRDHIVASRPASVTGGRLPVSCRPNVDERTAKSTPKKVTISADQGF